ncbi:MAG: ABC transporter ATP-binding protein/permease, partial [Spirochaetes bacterium]|nr:ABC transporter ATP-binding protein/permease [Spirochaetota bacterium]
MSIMFSTVIKILDWIGKYKRKMIWGFVWSFFISIFSSVPVILAAYTVNYILLDLKGITSLPDNFAWIIAFCICLSVLLKFLFLQLRAGAHESIGYEVTADERIAIGKVLKRVPLGYFEQHKTGDITATITSQLALLEILGTKTVDMIISGYITTAVIVLWLTIINTKVAFLSIAGIILSWIFLKMINSKSKQVSPKIHQAQEDMTRSVIEYLHGMSEVKSYGNEGAALDTIRNAFKLSMDFSISNEKKYAPLSALHVLSLKLATCGIISLVALFTIKGDISIAYSLMMLMFMFTIFSSIEKIDGSAHMLGIIESNIRNLRGLKDARFIDEDSSNLEISQYNITFDKVSFAYDTIDVIKNISFEVQQNSITAIVGPSGGGKSTICHLIARFYDVRSGNITVGGHNVKDFTCDSLLKNISMVFQKVYL